jgi:hypothetical protein
MTEETTSVEPVRLAGDFEAIEKRRALVREYLFQGTPYTIIAEMTGVDRRTIEADVAYIRKLSADHIEDMIKSRGAIAGMLGNMMDSLLYIRENAIMEYAAANTEMGKNGFLNTAMKATMSLANVLTTTGILPKAGQDLNIKTDHKITFASRFGEDSPLATLDDEKSRRRVLAAVGKALKLAPTEIVVEAKEDV